MIYLTNISPLLFNPVLLQASHYVIEGLYIFAQFLVLIDAYPIISIEVLFSKTELLIFKYP
jgi:hypothetical protein